MSNCWFQHWEINTSKQKKKTTRKTQFLSCPPLFLVSSPLIARILYSVPLVRQQGGTGDWGQYCVVPTQLLLHRFFHWLQPHYGCTSSCTSSLSLLGAALVLLLSLGAALLFLAFLPLYCPSCSGSFLISPLLLFGQFSCLDIVFSVSSCSSVVSHPAVTTLFYGAYAKNVFNLVWFIQVWCTVGLFCPFLSQLEMAVSSTEQFVTSCRRHPCATPTHPPATETLQLLPNKILFWYIYKTCSVLLRLFFLRTTSTFNI